MAAVARNPSPSSYFCGSDFATTQYAAAFDLPAQQPILPKELTHLRLINHHLILIPSLL